MGENKSASFSSLANLARPAAKPAPGPVISSSFSTAPTSPEQLRTFSAGDSSGSRASSLDPKLLEAISAAVSARLGAVEANLDKVLQLAPATTAAKKKKPAAPAKQGLVSALKPHFATLSASSAAVEAKDELDSDVDDDFPDPDAGASDSSGESYAPTVLANARTAGSVLNWVNGQDFVKTRNRYEAVALAAAIDSLVKDVPASHLGIEILCRRLTGVHLADQNNNWDLCKAVEWPYASQSLLDQRLMTRAVKDAAAIGRLRDRAAKKPSKSFERRGFSKSGSKSNNSFNNSKKSSGVGSKSAGAAQH